MATENIHIPSDEELTVPEVNLSSPALRAGAFHMGKYCENINNVSVVFWSGKFCYITL
jgi:NADH dehydrogenase (ubiquinone) 1 alpha subcomplex subunit 8